MRSGKRDILRAPATLEDIKRTYGKLSKIYSILEGRFERRLRERGLELLNIQNGEIVLEIGVGTGFGLEGMAGAVGRTGKACGIDITPQMLQLTRERVEKAGLGDEVELCEADARNMPYRDGAFDAVYTASTLELFDTPDIPRVLQEIRRVLKPDGRLAVASLSKEGREGTLFIRLYEWAHRRFPRYASCRPIYVEQAIRSAGFEVVHVEEHVLGMLVPMRLVMARPYSTSTASRKPEAGGI